MEFDVVGIFLPSSEVLEARQKHKLNQISDSQLRKIEDDAIVDIVEKQISLGLKNVTSGGIRWKYWDKDFFFGLDGIVKERFESGHVYSNEDALTDLMRFVSPIAYNPGHPYFDDFSFMADAVARRAICRQIIPSPAELFINILLTAEEQPRRICADPNDFLSDISETYRKTIQRLYGLGCHSIVFDDTVCGQLCGDSFTKRLLLGGIDVVDLHDKIINVINGSLSGAPSDLETAIYLSGGDTPVPEWELVKYADNIMPRVLSEVAVDKFFMPFNAGDEDTAGILQYIPDNKKVVLGLCDAHSPFPDKEESIKHFVLAAMRYIDSARLAISPKTGFNISSFAPRGLDYKDQWQKIRSLAGMAAKIKNDIVFHNS